MPVTPYTTTTCTLLDANQKSVRFIGTLNQGQTVLDKITAALAVANPTPGSQVELLQTFLNRPCPAGVQIRVLAQFNCEILP